MADERTVKESADSSLTSISADEAALYDRQIRLWGLDAQKRYAPYFIIHCVSVKSIICCVENIILCIPRSSARGFNALLLKRCMVA